MAKPFSITLCDKWSRLEINEANAPQLWVGMSSWGGLSIDNGVGERICGGTFSRNGAVDFMDIEGDLGPPPYYADISGYLCDTHRIQVNPGHQNLYLDVYSIKDFGFWDRDTGAPVGVTELFGGPIQVCMQINGNQANDTQGNPLVYTGDGSSARFSRIKPGEYELKITGPYFKEAQYEKNISVGLMEAYEGETNFYYTPPQLPQVAQPVWSKKVVTWKDVANAESYTVRLYNASAECLDEYTQRVTKGLQRYDYTDLIENYLPAGSYTATVQANPEVVT